MKPMVYSALFRPLDSPKSPDATLFWSTADSFLSVRSLEDPCDSKSSRIYLDDILSLKLAESGPAGEGPSEVHSNGFEIVYYPLENGKRTRRRAGVFCESDVGLQRSLTKRIQPPIPPHRPRCLVNRRTLVLINPFSGLKKAVSLFNTYSKSIFLDAGIECEIRYTKHANHAIEIATSLDIDNYECIAVVSGDGLVYEVLTGLVSRSDRARALLVPLLHIPGGTSNALAAAVAFKAGEPFSPRDLFVTELTLMAKLPTYNQLRLNRFESAADGHKLSFLSVAWGLVADIDIESERFRWAGLIRLHMEAFIRIMQLPTAAKYRGRISYLPVTDDAIIRKTRIKWNEARRRFGKHHFDGGIVTPCDDAVFPTHPPTLESLETALCDRSVVDIPPLSEPVPSDWVTVDSEFVCATICCLSHLGSDVPFMPACKMEDDILFLTFVDWRVVKNRFDVAKMFVDFDVCAHLDYSCMQIIPVRACRIEPAPGAGGDVAVDGEPCTRGSSFQVVATDLCATVVGRASRN